VGIARQRLIDALVARAAADGTLDTLVGAVARRELDPHTAADRLIGQ
jgi:hypothetical protein